MFISIGHMMNGVLNIDKPAEMTSHDVVDHIRQLLREGLPADLKVKVGHGGALDPFATGVLLILIGQATKLMQYVNRLSKTYELEVMLGATSDTDDVTGKITQLSKSSKPSKQEVNQVLKKFQGTIEQIPPAYAAIKVHGKKLYEYARQGKQVERRPRPVAIHSIDLLAYQFPVLRLRVNCGSGTYMRALARDIGQALGYGGYASVLRRTAISHFTIEQSASLHGLTIAALPSHLLPPETLLPPT